MSRIGSYEIICFPWNNYFVLEDACDMISSDDEHRDVVNVNTWLHKPDVKFSYPCQHIKETGFTYNR